MGVILRDLNEGDQFNIIIFDDKVEKWHEGFQPKSAIDTAVTYVNSLNDRGGIIYV
jgi:hypothetical protein